ncbi:MAG: hypothetical protein MZU97_21135 [Bacillus subtilis]|nr:hypothetical protein [Bacillus subtilis]
MNSTLQSQRPKQRLIVSPSSARSTTLVLVALVFLLVFVGAVENWLGIVDRLNAIGNLQSFLWSFAHADELLLDRVVLARRRRLRAARAWHAPRQMARPDGHRRDLHQSRLKSS